MKTTFRDRCKPRTQEQAEAWADELDKFLDGGDPKGRRIKSYTQADIVAEELDKWIASSL